MLNNFYVNILKSMANGWSARQISTRKVLRVGQLDTDVTKIYSIKTSHLILLMLLIIIKLLSFLYN